MHPENKKQIPVFAEVRLDRKINVIYINTGVLTFKHAEKDSKLKKVHVSRCVAKILSEEAVEQNDDILTQEDGLKLYYEAYEVLDR